jgi:competence protein ComEC
MARPLLALAAWFAVGCLAGDALPLRSAGALLALAGATLVLGLRTRRGPWAAVALAAGAVALGAAGAAVEARAYEVERSRWSGPETDGETPSEIHGTARGDGRDLGDRLVFELDVETVGKGAPRVGRLRLEVGGQAARPEILDGDRLSLWATLRPPRGFGDPGAFDALAQARRDDIVGYGYCKSPLLIRHEGPGDVSLLRRVTARARGWARRVFRKRIVPGPEEGLVRAMTLGDRTGVDPGTSEAFKAAGTYHVLAISGAQIALLAALLVWALRRIARPSALALAVATALVVYAALVGGDVPVVRAVVMAVVLLLGRALDLDSDLANLLGLAALVLLSHRPSSVGDVGFQLSFGATLAVVLLTAPLAAGLPRLPLRLEAGLAGSLAAQLALAPLLALHFHRLAPAALVLNLVAVPLSSAVLLGGLAVLLLEPLAAALATRAGDLAWLLAHALLRTSDLGGLIDALDFRVATPSPWVLVPHVLGLVLLVRGRLRAGLGLGMLATLSIVAGPPPRGGDGRLHVTALDVGQGQCLVVVTPRGRTFLVDAAGSFDPRFDMGEAVVGPYLWSQGITRVSAAVATHAHPDHVGGLPFVVRQFAVREVWEGLRPRHDPEYDSFDDALHAAAVARRAVVRGVTEDWDGVSVDVLGPRPRGRPPWKTRNDDSVVVGLAFGETRFLLTADIEAGAEAEIAARPSLVLTVPHHGSRSSSTPSFLAAVRPRLALVSVGARNRFGHPHPEVLERYAQLGTRVFRTDRDGAITVSTDGARVWVRTFRGGGEERFR